jgi:zinc protease
MSPSFRLSTSAGLATVAVLLATTLGGPLLAKQPPVLLPVPADPTVSLLVWFDVGSQDDPPGKEGLAYLTGQLLADGATKQHSYEQILELLYPMAAGYQARVDREMTTLSGRTHRDNLDAYVALFTQAYLEPAFKAEDLERVRSNALNTLEKSLRYASDEELGKAGLLGAVYAGTPYAHPSIGTVTGVKAITLDDVKAFYARYYTGDRTVVALGGGYSQSLVDRLTASLDTLPPSPAREAVKIAPPPLVGRHVQLIAKPGADASISFGFPLDVHRGERDYYALWLANSWLGEHRNSSSHLYEVIRELRGLNYGDYSYVEAYPEGGRRQMPPANVARHHQLFEVWIRTLPNAQAHFALRAAVREVESLVQNGLTQEQFDLTRSFLQKYALHFAETTSNRLGYAVDDRFYALADTGNLARFQQAMANLTRDEVNAALRRHLNPANLMISIVTGDAEAMAKALGSDAASPITYATEKPAAVLEEDKVIATYPLGIPAANVKVVPVETMFEK